ncbi:MAG: DUF3347 domain-containing protein [Gemmatimonadales bacterium]|nr:DUF3347 domain-containing protein [Gemmatimonadales bacterium]
MFTKNPTLLVVLLLATAIASPTLANCQQHGNHAAANNFPPSVFQGLVEDYLAIQTALAEDTIEGVADHARSIEKSAHDLSSAFDLTAAGVSGKDSDTLKETLPDLAGAAGELSRAGDLDATRKSFGALSDAMIVYRELVSGEKPKVAYCSMTKQSWLQDGNKIANPYFGSAMLRCGSIVEK